MKHIRYTKLFGWLAATTILLTTSCKDDLFESSNGLSDKVTVSFSLAPEAASISMRSTENGHVTYPQDGGKGHISDGSKADLLIYAVYDSKGNLLDEYNDNTEAELKELETLGITPGKGQTIKRVFVEKEDGTREGTCFPYKVDLTLKRGEQYTVAFWAQSSKTKAYDTEDLKKVEVIYSEITDEIADDDSNSGTSTPNNDEFRDAFCRSVSFTPAKGGMEQNVLLYRPLAQINVGTSGYDYEIATRGQTKYKYSKIRINRVARYLDVVNDETIESTTGENEKSREAFAVVDFGYAPIPAYVNYETSNIPDDPSYTKWDWLYGSGVEGLQKETYKDEEFLRVKLDSNRGTYIEDKYDAYDESKDGDGFSDYANLDNNNQLSETFKYLSMCYVLTSSKKEDAVVINNVKVWLAEDAEGTKAVQLLDIDHVPAQRNWRTNIIGNLLTEEETFEVKLDKDFAGEYNLWNNGTDWEMSGPLAEGVYYDAANDEIQISNKEGLFWLQRMVNGNLTVREVPNLTGVTIKGAEISNVQVGDKYKYYDTSGGEQELSYKAYSSSDYTNDETLKNRILQATHQKEWPKNNNFHFMGFDESSNVKPAKVKLMADIDLEGEEWIPIGFDSKVFDGSPRNYFNANKGYAVYNNRDNMTQYSGNGKTDGSEVRAFCGIFDGNGHTISNMSTKRFGAKVHIQGIERDTSGPYDNPQWFANGLFGLVGGNAEIMNLRMLNVDVYGYHTGGGIVGNVCGDAVKITGCTVDGGTLTLDPMYRGDLHKNKWSEQDNERTWARGIYLGGIVGYYNAKGEISNCHVRNVTMRAYRQIGGIVGTFAGDVTTSIGNYEGFEKNSPDVFKDNAVSNTVIIANKFQPYDYCRNVVVDGTYVNGFGWTVSQISLAGRLVGGKSKADGTNYTDYMIEGNDCSKDVYVAEFSTNIKSDTDQERTASVDFVPLKELPILSSWFCDKITLAANFYGESLTYTTIKSTQSFKLPSIGGKSCEKVAKTYALFPFKIPFSNEIIFDTDSHRTGVYVESVELNGNGAIGGRSVITPIGVDGEGSCAMYVTSRDRKNFLLKDNAVSNATDGMQKKSTDLKNLVLRGEPYAYTGLLIAPNENMSKVTLEKVAIYDVYQTIALDNTNTDWAVYPYNNGTKGQANGTASIELEAKGCNLRGYTVPGAGWSKITYISTTFERGASTGHPDDEQTCKVEAQTDFDGCYFKAPYTIEVAEGVKANFKNQCWATAASPTNEEIANIDGCVKIVIEKDAQGNPVVKYYKNKGAEDYYDKDNNHYDKDGNKI